MKILTPLLAICISLAPFSPAWADIAQPRTNWLQPYPHGMKIDNIRYLQHGSVPLLLISFGLPGPCDIEFTLIESATKKIVAHYLGAKTDFGPKEFRVGFDIPELNEIQSIEYQLISKFTLYRYDKRKDKKDESDIIMQKQRKVRKPFLVFNEDIYEGYDGHTYTLIDKEGEKSIFEHKILFTNDNSRSSYPAKYKEMTYGIIINGEKLTGIKNCILGNARESLHLFPVENSYQKERQRMTRLFHSKNK